jgi:hypothetical protein
LQTLSGDLVLHIFQRADIVAQVQFAFSLPAYYLEFRDVLLPSLMDALFNYITSDLILNELITILCHQSRYNTVLLTLFRQAADQQIVGLYDRLQKVMAEKLYTSVCDANFRQLVDALCWGAWAGPLPSPPSACYLDQVLPIIPQQLLYRSLSERFLDCVLFIFPDVFSHCHKRPDVALFYQNNRYKTRRWLLQNADLSDPIVLQAVLRCTGLRFVMFDFLMEIEVDLIQLPDIFPLLISPLWKVDGHKRFFDDLADLQEAGKHELVAAILQLPAVLQSCRSYMENIIKGNWAISHSLYKMLDFESPFVSELFIFRFGPDRDQFLHWYCRKNCLDLIQMVSTLADFHSQNECGLVPFRYLSWSMIPRLINLDRNLASVMLQSDPDCIVGRNCDLILQEGFEPFISQTDFVQALFEQIPSCYCYSDLFQSLYDSCDEELFDRRETSNLNQPTQLHEAFVLAKAHCVFRLIVMVGADVQVKDGDGRVPFQYADDETLSYLMIFLPTEAFNNLIQSDVRTFIRLSFRLLKKKHSWSGIQFLFDHVDLFVSCLASVVVTSSV